MRARWLTVAFAAMLIGGSASAQGSPGANGAYATATEAELDSLYAPLGYLMRPDERGVYPGLSLEGKRDFLRRFWARRNPTPGAPENAAAAVFSSRLAYVNRKLNEHNADGAPIAGWRTDRGRIYLENGPPDHTLSGHRPTAPLPYQVWKYTKGKVRKYCFIDVTLFGNFVLVFSTDGRETTLPDWPLVVGPDAAREIATF